MPKKEMYYTIILDNKQESNSDPSTQITFLNQRIQKSLSVIITKEEFLSRIKKFISPPLDTIIGLTNSFFNL